jgi:hypothetical protein
VWRLHLDRFVLAFAVSRDAARAATWSVLPVSIERVNMNVSRNRSPGFVQCLLSYGYSKVCSHVRCQRSPLALFGICIRANTCKQFEGRLLFKRLGIDDLSKEDAYTKESAERGPDHTVATATNHQHQPTREQPRAQPHLRSSNSFQMNYYCFPYIPMIGAAGWAPGPRTGVSKPASAGYADRIQQSHTLLQPKGILRPWFGPQYSRVSG